MTIQNIALESAGISAIKGVYEEDEDFKDIYKVCVDMTERYHTEFSEFLIQDGYLFKGGLLCVPRSSIREYIIKEKHCGSLARHFGVDKTLESVRRFYFWPKLQTDVRKFVETCVVCQKSKGHTSYVGLYTPLAIP